MKLKKLLKFLPSLAFGLALIIQISNGNHYSGNFFTETPTYGFLIILMIEVIIWFFVSNNTLYKNHKNRLDKNQKELILFLGKYLYPIIFVILSILALLNINTHHLSASDPLIFALFVWLYSGFRRAIVFKNHLQSSKKFQAYVIKAFVAPLAISYTLLFVLDALKVTNDFLIIYALARIITEIFMEFAESKYKMI